MITQTKKKIQVNLKYFPGKTLLVYFYFSLTKIPFKSFFFMSYFFQ